MSFDSTLEMTSTRRRPAEGVAQTKAANRSSSEQANAARSATREAGASLDASTQRSMGERFGHDFSGVRVHSDARAADSARNLDSLAYSFGSHVVFGEGRYSPGTPGGDRLLAHELAHVVQQDGAESQMDERQSAGTPTLEHEADHAAESVASGGRAAIGHRAASPTVLRQAAPAQAPGAQTPAAPAPAPKRPVEKFEKVGRGKNLTAELDRGSGWLSLEMRVRFEKDDSVSPWPADDSDFKSFQGAFCRLVEKRWSTKHFLVPKVPCPGEPVKTVVRVQVTPVQDKDVPVIRVKNTPAKVRSFGSPAQALLNTHDVRQRSDFAQTPVDHEFGHMLGLQHIHCDGAEENDCYGVTRDEKGDVMGEGSFVSPRDYEVFAEIMTAITGCKYGVQQASVLPPPNNAAPLGALIGATVLGGIGMALGSLAGPLGAFIGGAVGIGLGALAGYFFGKSNYDKPGDVPA